MLVEQAELDANGYVRVISRDDGAAILLNVDGGYELFAIREEPVASFSLDASEGRHLEFIRTVFTVGSYAKNIESGWLGKIVSFENDQYGERMARMIGVDFMANNIAGLSREESLSPDDVALYSVADLIPA